MTTPMTTLLSKFKFPADMLHYGFRKQNASERINLQDIMQLRTAFLVADKDQSYGLKPREFINAFGNVLGKGQGRKALMQLFMSIDADAGGTIGK